MKKRLLMCLFTIVVTFSWAHGNAHAVERVVAASVPSDLWYENVFLLAEPYGMGYQNFIVQVGYKSKQTIYRFPKWKDDKYGPNLFREDINGDKLKDIIVTLDHSKNQIHVLNEYIDPIRNFREVHVEEPDHAVKRLVKMERKGNIVKLQTTVQQEVMLDLKELYHYKLDPNNLTVSTSDKVQFFVVKNKLTAYIGVWVPSLESPIGRPIGDFILTYEWDGKQYIVKDVMFERYIPPLYD